MAMTRASFFTGLAGTVAVLVASVSTGGSALAAEPTVPECVSASNASVDLLATHRLRQARARLLVCVAGSCPEEVRAECSRRMDQLTAAIPTIVFVAKDAAGLEVSAVKVAVDGEVVADHLDGTALALDPGSHELTFQAAGEAPVTRTIILHEGEKDRHEVLVIGRGTPAPAAPAVAPSPAADSSAEPRPHDSGHGPARTLAVVAGATGLAGLAVGSVFGALTFSAWAAADRECRSRTDCSTQATQNRSDALTFATVSNVAFIAGGALLAGGITLYLSAPSDHTPAASVEVSPGGVSVRGRF
jgi:hypothetical protein